MPETKEQSIFSHSVFKNLKFFMSFGLMVKANDPHDED